MSSSSTFQGQNIQVSVRCRPLRPNEQRSVVEALPYSQEVRVLDRHSLSDNETKDFIFDNVFGQESEQATVYDSVVRPLVDQVLLGFNCTVFAYGQTGTGKTYTMEGYRSNDDVSWENDPSIGLIPRAISHLFAQLRQSGEEYSVKTSFLELYNEDAYDLLSPIDDTTKLKIFDDVTRKGSVIVGGLTDHAVNSKDEIYSILRQGSEKRQKASTLLNACSSRSHTIFCITVQIKDTSIEGDDLVKIGKLNLVDMAGSENIGRSGAQDKRAREAGNINQSLLTLGRVITALVEKRPHIPYRESKLTRLLQDSLGGKTKTSIIATISPAIPDLEDTLSTLEYATRARGIVNRPETNMQLSNKKTLSSLSKEIHFLMERHSTELCELEFRVRNEVALEFKREMDKMKKSYEDDFTNLKLTYEKDLNNIIKSRDDLELVNENLKRQNLVERELAEYRMKLNTELENRFKTREIEHQAEIQKLQEDIKALREQLTKANETANVKAPANKIRAKAPVLEESSEYVNMTFDGADEIAQVSAKKPRKKVVPGITRKDLNQQITCSGRKTKLPPSDPDPELSPIEPVRVTRSRATKRKLNF